MWLDPCTWAFPVSTVTLSATNSHPNVTIRLRKGVAIPIRVEDTSGLLDRHEGKTPGAVLLLGLSRQASPFRSATTLSRDANGRNYQVVVPFATPLKLLLSSSFFKVSDGTGVPLIGPASKAALLPILVPAGVQPAAVRFV